MEEGLSDASENIFICNSKLDFVCFLVIRYNLTTQKCIAIGYVMVTLMATRTNYSAINFNETSQIAAFEKYTMQNCTAVLSLF